MSRIIRASVQAVHSIEAAVLIRRHKLAALLLRVQLRRSCRHAAAIEHTATSLHWAHAGGHAESLACWQVLNLYNLVPKPYPALTGRVSNLSGVITAQGTQCVLPYAYNGSAHDICLTADNGQAGA